jgi:hypothetical protein
MTKILGAICAFSLLVLVGSSCTQERLPCLTPKTVTMKVKTVRWVNSSLTTDTVLQTSLWGAVTETGTRGYAYAGRSSYALTLSPVSDSSVWLFAPDTTTGTPIDTLTFRYERVLTFLSNACGYTYYFNLVSATNTTYNIDSVRILNASITNNANTNHLQIYVHPRP